MAQLIVKSISLHRFKKYRDTKVDIPVGYTLLAGENNSGKSSFMQAFAIWEFCKYVISIERGEKALLQDGLGGQGIGISSEDFLPINLPSLKHLWTNLRVAQEDRGNGPEPDAYTLWIKLTWAFEDVDKFLQISLSLNNERLLIKATDSNLIQGDLVPKVAYIPPFAGILKKEPYHTPAMRNRLIGQGLSGSAIRNTMLELYRANKEKRKLAKGDRPKIPPAELKRIRENDPWEHLTAIVRKIFFIEMYVKEFDDRYHTYISIDYKRGKFEADGRFKPFTDFNKRDIMVEGSGFLQMLNVISLALDPAYHVIFLDEPDAHLHPSLQFKLQEELIRLADKYKKHILLATHSTELIESHELGGILKFENSQIKRLNKESQRVSLITGLGRQYNTKINSLLRHKKILFVENDSDFNVINKWADIYGKPLPSDIVVWPTSNGHKERLHLFTQLSVVIKGLIGISLRDRDMAEFLTVDGSSLFDKSYPWKMTDSGITARTWRFKYIEGYVLRLTPVRNAAVAKGLDPELVVQHVQDHFGIVLLDYPIDQIPVGLRELPAKEIVSEGEHSLANTFGIGKYELASAFTDAHLHQDVKQFIDLIRNCFKK
ncbi:ATP-dependent nuclease [Aeromonas veronii]|uniref:ATP-dependent nuclease n=1 Tax=Aeromonas veronii TaxID=654 RepID=UPI002B479DF9|nr:AAA family ATPase [Aeromonas veronii]